MIVHRRKKFCSGKGFINNIINKLPFELHVPGYQYCGPGTKLAKRLARGDPGINPLDAACKEHDIAYSKSPNNIQLRNEADKVLAEKAWRRVLAKDASVGEKAVAWGVTNAMKMKTKIGAGMRRLNKKKKNNKRKKPTSLKQIVALTKRTMQPGVDPIQSALKSAQKAVKKIGGKKEVCLPRILPVPSKVGGFLPFLIPLFAGLSATGALAGGAAGIARAVNNAREAKQQLKESQRHNATMEAIALGKGLYLKPYKKGLGLYLNPSKNL